MVQVEDHWLFLGRGGHAQVYLRGYLGCNLLAGTILDGHFPVLIVDRDDAAIGEHLLRQLAFAHKFKIGPGTLILELLGTSSR